ncbi:MAG: Arginine--tRNA ligase [Calditrichaeota bacterium]|nr:Arginine--tRNA ligase [Calditrichota bacterium]
MNLKDRLTQSLRPLVGPDVEIRWTIPKHKRQGDLSTNAAMIAAGRRGVPPRELAQELARAIPARELALEKVEVAGPGFVNVWVGAEYYQSVVHEILREGPAYGASAAGGGRSVIVEFVSANPTGPLNVVSARAGAIGDSLVRVLRKAGYRVSAEFYVNDSGRQVRRLGESVIARARGKQPPEDGYHGGDVIELARRIYAGRDPSEADDSDEIGRLAAEHNVERQRAVLDRYRVAFDRWFRESELHEQDAPARALEQLRERGAIYEKDGATWFAGSRFGDDEDRVVVTSGGRPTYLLPDLAYHLNKAARGNKTAIDLLGPDHHDYVNRMQAALTALGHDRFLEVLIVQQVHLVRGGERVKMSKRAGKLVTLGELLEEVGVDVARYFFLQRKTSTPLEFDLDLAREQSDRNPVYYVQYAHTRIRGILRQEGFPSPNADSDLSPLGQPEEIELIKHLERFGETIARAADTREPQRLVGYLEEIANRFHKFYTAHRVVGVEPDVSEARGALVLAAGIVLKEGLNLLGVHAPERM